MLRRHVLTASLALVPVIALLSSAGSNPAVQTLGSAVRPVPGHATLYAEDFLRHTLSLRTGRFGTRVQEHAVVNVDSELDFGAYAADAFTAGVQGGQVGELLDLGTSTDLAARYGYEETVGGGQGFSSIRFEGGVLVILADRASATVQPFGEGSAFLASAPPVSSEPVPVHLGHVYLVRIVDRFDPSFARVAKLLVTAHRPGESATFVWQELVL